MHGESESYRSVQSVSSRRGLRMLFIYHLFRTQSTSNEQIERESRPQLNQTCD